MTKKKKKKREKKEMWEKSKGECSFTFTWEKTGK